MNVMTLRSIALVPRPSFQFCSQHLYFCWAAQTCTTTGTPHSLDLKKQLSCRVGPTKCPPSILQTRTFYTRLLKKLKPFPEKIQKKDNVSPHYELVYKTDTSIYIQMGLGGVQVVAGCMVFTMGALAVGIHPPNIDLALDDPVRASIFVIVNVLICLGIFQVTYTHPMRIYYSESEDQFIVVFVGQHPFSVRLLNIQPGEVKPLELSVTLQKIIPWSFGMCTSPTQKIFLNEHNFKYPIYFNKLFGYGK